LPTRINKYVAQITSLSRRAVDGLILNEQIKLNGQVARLGDIVNDGDQVLYNDKVLEANTIPKILILVNKPTGYVCSRAGQGSKTIYELLPDKYQDLKTVGRLDKESSGLILLTNDGDLNNRLSHPSFNKSKIYEVRINKPMNEEDKVRIENGNILLDDKPSSFMLRSLSDDLKFWEVVIQEGRNRQIRRTFYTLGYTVTHLKRTQFDKYKLDALAVGKYRELVI
jgi:23S rRNA pseudouridine2605 synthase